MFKSYRGAAYAFLLLSLLLSWQIYRMGKVIQNQKFQLRETVRTKCGFSLGGNNG